MIPTALAVLAGVVGLQLLTALPASWVAAPLAVGAVLCLRRRPTRPLAWALAAFLWAWWQAGLQLDRDLPPVLEGGDLILRGTVVSLPEADDRVTRFVFESRSRAVGAEWIAFERRLRLSWYTNAGDVAPVAAGTSWQLTVRLKRRHGFHNPGGFDYEGWLFRNGISATGYVRPYPAAAPLPGSGPPLLRLRAAVDDRLTAVLAGNSQAGLLRALALGARGDIAAAEWEVLRATGTGHLVAISGLHIGLAAGLAFAVVRWLWSRSATLTLYLAAPRAAALAAFAAATLYAVLAGFGIPARRAWIMAGAMLLGLALRRCGDPWQRLALALTLVTLTDPAAVNGPGFWLSFTAVAVILAGLARTAGGPYITGRAGRLRRQIRSLLHLQLLLSVGLLPFTLGFFGQFGWTAPAANLLAVPWTSLVIVPLVFVGLLLLFPAPAAAGWVFGLAGSAAALMQRGLAAAAGLPGSLLALPAAPLAISLLAGVGIVCLLLPKGVPRRLFGLVLLLPLLSWRPPQPAPGSAWLTLLDVGQGLAAVVRTRHHVLVYDAGPRFGPDFDAGRAVVAPFLEAHGLRHVDLLLVSHGDNDHRGGAHSLDRRIPVFRVLTSAPRRIDWRYSRRCRAGQRWEWDGVTFHVLHPETTEYSAGNDASCVLQVRTAGGDSALLPGDIEAAAERTLVRDRAGALASTVLIAPHHGSRSSSTAEFIAAVDPRWVLFPVGYRNRYGFPRPAVSARYRAHGSGLLTTAGSGAIELHLGEGGAALRPTQHRYLARRYWQNPPEVPPDQ